MNRKRSVSPLWRIMHPELAVSNSYLLGSVHISDQRVFQMLPVLKSCIDKCDVYAAEHGELDKEPSADAIFLPHGNTLDNYLNKAQQRKVNILLSKVMGLNNGAMHYRRMRPLILVNAIVVNMLPDNPHQTKSLDNYLFDYARASHKLMTGVESLAEQVEIMKDIPLSFQFKQLLELARNPAGIKRHYNKLADLYEKQRLYELHKSAKKSMGITRKLLLYDRNQVMAERLADLYSTHSTFATIGVGHLFGGKGVLRLLKKHGFKIQEIH